MSNYITAGPIALKVSNRHLAVWGYPLLKIGGLSLWTRDSGGGLGLASYHPASSLTWLWGLSVRKADWRWFPRFARSEYPRSCGGYVWFLWLGRCFDYHWQRYMPRQPHA